MYGSYGASRPAPVPQGLTTEDLGGLDEDDVKSLVQQELDSAVGQDGGTLSGDRLKAQQYYEGQPFGNEVDGRSQVVMRSVLEAVEWVLPALIRIFTASDKICEVDPPVPEPMMPGMPPPVPPEVLAKQATEYLNHIFYRDNAGFMILHDWFKDALLEKLGWVKYWWDTQKTVETKEYSGLIQPQLDALLGQADVELVKEKRYQQEVDAFTLDRPFPAPGPVELIDVTLRYERKYGRTRIENVPPEEILFSRRAKRGNVPFIAHRRRWTYSDLIQEGYDEDCLELVPLDDSMEWNTERNERYREDDTFGVIEARRDAGRQIWVEESYIGLSKDGKTTELYRVMTAGHGLIILSKDGKPCIECVEAPPFVPICPIPLSHRLVGLSLADLTMDLQEIKSSIIRQMIDNAYLSNWPRVEVADDASNENTYDDLLTLRPGGLVRTKRIGGIQPMMIPYTADKSFPLIQYLDETQEVRTGVARHNQGINPDDLNQTATGVSLLQQAAAQRVELFARLFAHGVEELMRGIMGLVRRHQQQERIIRVTGAWLRVDPRQWREDMPVTVSVGLGTGNRDQLLAHLMQIIQLQGTIVTQQGGATGPLVYPQNVYDALRQLQDAAGFKASFFTDPSAPPPQPPPGMGAPGGPQGKPPDPAVMKAQAAIQAVQMKAQADTQASQQKAQLDVQMQQQKAQLEAQLAQQKLQHEMMLDQQRAEHQMDLERQKSANQIAIERARADADATARMREIELKYAAGAYAAGQQPPPASNGGMVE